MKGFRKIEFVIEGLKIKHENTYSVIAIFNVCYLELGVRATITEGACKVYSLEPWDKVNKEYQWYTDSYGSPWGIHCSVW